MKNPIRELRAVMKYSLRSYSRVRPILVTGRDLIAFGLSYRPESNLYEQKMRNKTLNPKATFLLIL